MSIEAVWAREVDLGALQRPAGSDQERGRASLRGALAEYPHSWACLEDPANKQAGERKVGKGVHEAGN